MKQLVLVRAAVENKCNFLSKECRIKEAAGSVGAYLIACGRSKYDSMAFKLTLSIQFGSYLGTGDVKHKMFRLVFRGRLIWVDTGVIC